MLHLLPARLGRLDLHGRGGALDGLHLPQLGLLPGEEEGGALQGSGSWSVEKLESPNFNQMLNLSGDMAHST